MECMSQRDYIEYGTSRNLTFVVPAKVSICDPKAGPIEREEIARADRIDLLVSRKERSERQNFKGY